MSTDNNFKSCYYRKKKLQSGQKNKQKLPTFFEYSVDGERHKVRVTHCDVTNKILLKMFCFWKIPENLHYSVHPIDNLHRISFCADIYNKYINKNYMFNFSVYKRFKVNFM